MAEQIPTEDGGLDVILDEKKAIVPLDDSVNLAFEIEKKKNSSPFVSIHDPKQNISGVALLKEMGAVVVNDYKRDLASRSDWADNTAKDIKMFNNFMGKKNFPWPNASNVNLPFITIATLQFQARAYDALIPSKEVVKVVDPGQDDPDRAKRVEKFMDYQLLYQMEDFEPGMDKTMMQLPLEGSVFKKTYYDATIGLNRSEYVSAMDFVMSYYAKNLEEALRKTHTLYMTRSDIMKRVKSGIFRTKGEDLEAGTLSNPNQVIKQAIDDAEGKKEPAPEADKPRIILEQHREWDLNGDGITEPYVITVDLEAELVLRITSRRYIDGLGKMQTYEYFTDYTFFPNPEGSYGLGFGSLMRGLNEAGNTILNEIIDAGMLANMQGGFYLKKFGLKSADLSFQRGEYKGIDAYVDDIRKAFIKFDFKGPDQTLFATLGLLFEYSKLISSVSETMTGQMPSSDTPATTILSLLEEGRKVFSAIHKRSHRSFKKELKKLYLLNSINLDENEMFQVLGKANIPQGEGVKIGKSDFVDTYNIVPVSDPTITSRTEKIVKAETIMKDVRATQPNNKKANFIATKRYYEALETPNAEELLESPEPPDLPPEEENAMFLMERPSQVLPEQDDQHHIESHTLFKESNFSEQLTPAGAKLWEKHMQEHYAQMYLELEQKNKEGQMAGQNEGGSV